MNVIRFFTIIAWIGVIGGGITVALNLLLIGYFEFTERGIRDKTLNTIMGRTYTYPTIFPSLIILLICSAALFSM